MGGAWDHLPHVYLMKGAWIICLMFASWGEHGSFASCLPHGGSMDHLHHGYLMGGAGPLSHHYPLNATLLASDGKMTLAFADKRI